MFNPVLVSPEVRGLQDALDSIQLEISRTLHPIQTYRDEEHTQVTGFWPWAKVSTHGVLRVYFQIGRPSKFFSDAELAQEQEDFDAIVNDLREQEKDAAKALRNRIQYKEDLAAATAKGAEATRLAMIKYALMLNPNMFDDVETAGGKAVVTIQRAQDAIAAWQLKMNRAQGILDAAKEFGYTRPA